MKFETNTQNGFKPFTVTMTFETREEALTWSNMMSFNLTVPNVTHVEEELKDKVTKQMTAFRYAIDKGLINAS